jgi:hypothetical protein
MPCRHAKKYKQKHTIETWWLHRCPCIPKKLRERALGVYRHYMHVSTLDMEERNKFHFDSHHSELKCEWLNTFLKNQLMGAHVNRLDWCHFLFKENECS